MKAYTVKDIIKNLKQDDSTNYLERFQFTKSPMWSNWIDSPDIYNIRYESKNDSREFEDNIKVIGIPSSLVDMLAHIDSLRFINENPAILEKTKIENEEIISDIENELWGLSYRYGVEKRNKDEIYLFWIWSNGYFIGVFKGKIPSIISKHC